MLFILGKYLLDKDIDWPNCLKRNLVNMKENKLKEFHFKILYNLIPVRKNILKWNFSPDDLCKSCNESEDIIHAFISCKCNDSFKSYVCWLIGKVFDTDTEFTVELLIKACDESIVDHIMSIAFWSVYKMIILRNKKRMISENLF